MNESSERGFTATNDEPNSGAETKPVMLGAVTAGFNLASIRCGVEIRLEEVIRSNDSLSDRIKGLAKEREHARVRSRLDLMTNGYRVDDAITPRLSRLGTVLARALRLVQPLDIFVQASNERNAFCLPSRKGNRLIMCLYSGLISSLSSQELLFVMGHEVGHAILRHDATLGVGFDNPDFSPLEVIKVRGLERSHEISCDRFGLLACQDVRVASTALFKIASGLNERWIAFDEMAYSRHFDELCSMSELVDLEDASRTHPLTPLRVKALISFSKSETFAKAFGRSNWSIPATQMEQAIETMLSVLDPDVSELEGQDEQAAANRFLFDGALLVIGADGVVAPEEVAWLEARTQSNWSSDSLARDLSNREYLQELNNRIESNAAILRNKLSEYGRANLLHLMCDIAHCAGGIPESEFEILEHLRRLLKISGELARTVLNRSQSESQGEADDGESATPDEDSQSASETSSSHPLEVILHWAKLPDKVLVEAKTYCEQACFGDISFKIAVRTLVAWAIQSSGSRGPLSQAQGRKIILAAVKFCREVLDQQRTDRKVRPSNIDELIRQHGLISLFRRNETVQLGVNERQYAILSISRSKGVAVVAPTDDLQTTTEVSPHEMRKDVDHGDWPSELTDI